MWKWSELNMIKKLLIAATIAVLTTLITELKEEM